MAAIIGLMNEDEVRKLRQRVVASDITFVDKIKIVSKEDEKEIFNIPEDDLGDDKLVYVFIDCDVLDLIPQEV